MSPLRSLSLAIFLLASPAAGAVQQRQGETMEIVRLGTRPSSPAPAEYFTGRVRLERVFDANEQSSVSAGKVTFEPGARSHWHTHPRGQRLIVTDGIGWTQVEGGAVEEIRPGDVVWCPPGVKHWHGASATHAMTHIAVQEAINGRNVDWMEPVTDQQYGAREARP
ncbi:cupin domain-containing protein [Sphingomonas tabacisoli]|uniref:Cupin domain-containing protein n=1 Tax=Sphingomonas tabacisoli TaxID=2249466 RepID=A0ABW4I6Z1_9SPHN